MDTFVPPPVTAPCCASPSCRPASASAASTADRLPLIREAFRLEWLTVGWMVIEAAVAIWAGILAGNLVLLAFGLDSIIELISAGILIWRLSVELRHGQAFSETAERTASRLGGVLLFVLAAYVVASAAWGLWSPHEERVSVPGLAVTALAIPIMRYLARRKISIADKLGSRAMRTDAMESITCGWLSLVALISLAVETLTGAWFVDSIGSLVIVGFLVKEGREAWSGEECGCG